MTPPKLKREWTGLRVKLLRDLTTVGGAFFKKGKIMKVVGYHRGMKLTALRGKPGYISRVAESSVEFLENVAMIRVEPQGRRGKFPEYAAKVGTNSSDVVVIKRARVFHVGQQIEYASIFDMQGMSVGMTPTWKRGTIWLIDHNRIFIK